MHYVELNAHHENHAAKAFFLLLGVFFFSFFIMYHVLSPIDLIGGH